MHLDRLCLMHVIDCDHIEKFFDVHDRDAFCVSPWQQLDISKWLDLTLHAMSRFCAPGSRTAGAWPWPSHGYILRYVRGVFIIRTKTGKPLTYEGQVVHFPDTVVAQQYSMAGDEIVKAPSTSRSSDTAPQA